MLFTTIVLAALWFGAGAASALDVSVLDAPFNARGNGTTNDRPAIQSAIDAVTAAGGGTVNLPGTHTYLSGDVQLKNGVTLNVNAGAKLKQSTNPADYLHTPSFGRDKEGTLPDGSPIKFNRWADTNFPFVFAGNASNVAVTGAGTIEMSSTASDLTTIMEHTIGFNNVSNFTISNVTISGAMAYNMTIRNSDHGEIHHVTTTAPAALNSDGVSLMNSSFISVHDNNLTTMDDGIYVWASYADPRKSAWWDSDTPHPSHDIEVFNNVVNDIASAGSHGFLFINWTQDAPDASLVEISRLNVHDNQFSAPIPLAALTGDPYHPGPRKTPTKALTFSRNRWTSTVRGPLTDELNAVATTDFSGDDPLYNFGVITNELVNSNFDGLSAFNSEVGTSFWSTEGGAVSGSASVGQPGGRYGEIHDFPSGYAGIYQGVKLTPGTYTFSAALQSSDVSVRLFAIRASNPLQVMASTSFNTLLAWQTRSITFTVTQTDNYRLGIDNLGSGGSASSFARIDSATLTKIA
jgi:hypothetical protein